MRQITALEVLKSRRNVFLTGEAGSGKTYTVNQFTAWLRQEGIGFAITASTGIAATHVGGSTIHSWSGVGINRGKVNDAFVDKKLNNDRFLVERLNSVGVLIIDEISMIDEVMLNEVEFMIRMARGSSKPWGGMQVVFVGDFFQLPPVVYGMPVFAFQSYAWEKANVAVCYLTEQHRQADPVFLDLLGAMRNSRMEEKHRELLRACRLTATPETRLFTHNDDVDHINDSKLAAIDSKVRTFTMEEEGFLASDKANAFLIAQLKKGVLSPEKLNLKVGARVMFTRNKYDADTRETMWVNGTIGTVVAFDDEYGEGGPIVQTVDGQEFKPELEAWQYIEDDFCKARIRQYPLKLAWAITVHKSQGMTLDEASMDLSRAFGNSMGYVAVSRVRSLAGIHFEGINASAFNMSPVVMAQDKIFRIESEKYEG